MASDSTRIRTAGLVSSAADSLPAVGLNDSLRIPAHEIPILRRKAEHGDHEAALKLASHYGVYLSDRKKQVYYYRLAAQKNSEVAVENLVTLYSRADAKSFDFEKALLWRCRLKELAQMKGIKIESDGDWGYGLYLGHLSDKDRGLFFLKYAAKHDSKDARKELIEIYSNDPDARNPKKARYWQRLDASKLRPTQTLAAISNTTGQSTDHLPLGNPPPQYRLVIKDNPAEMRFDLTLMSSDNRTLCVSIGGWPDGLGHVDWGSSWVKLNSKSRVLPARDWNFGSCEGEDCSHRVDAKGALTGFIGYAEFGDPKEISVLSDRRLLFETSAYVCPKQ